MALLARRRTHLPGGTCRPAPLLRRPDIGAGVRETVVDRDRPDDPALLVVEFRLRVLRGRWHRLFLWECILNTPLFVGFPGFVSKLWLDRDERERYRGLYEWNDAAGAEFYARSLWRVLELVCRPGSIHYRVIPGLRRDDVLDDPQLLAAIAPEDGRGLVARGRSDLIRAGLGPAGCSAPARCLMPSSILRSMTRLPGSIR